jgi:hypothetical protein
MYLIVLPLSQGCHNPYSAIIINQTDVGNADPFQTWQMEEPSQEWLSSLEASQGQVGQTRPSDISLVNQRAQWQMLNFGRGKVELRQIG